MNEGWVCPRCRRVWSPSIDHCTCTETWEPGATMPVIDWAQPVTSTADRMSTASNQSSTSVPSGNGFCYQIPKDRLG